MNLLLVLHAPPFPPDLGPSRRHYHELQQFLAHGHRVSVLSYGSAADEAAFAAYAGNRCARVRFVSLHTSAAGKAWGRARNLASGQSDLARLRTRGMQHALDEMVQSDDFDVIWFSTTMLGALRLPEGIPLVGDTHNVEFDNLRRAFEETPRGPLRAYFGVQSARTRREEIAHTRKFDVVCTTSEHDRSVLRRAVPDARVEVVPNGVDLDDHQPREGPGEPGAIVFTGLMSYYPNAHGIRWFLDDIFPIVRERVPHARVLVVGADPPRDLVKASGKRVTVTGFVPDVRPYLARAQAFVIPLRIGGGTRVKALQAMAMGAPVVSTSLGVEGLDMGAGEHALVADDPQAFAAAVVHLVENPTIGADMARRAARHVRRYDWRLIGERLEGILTMAAPVARRRTGVSRWSLAAHTS